ncbi:hypothetical protein EIL50_04530 [bacterium NHP-B]|nr:hypothetical protein EIL50_04530 [bacterium NHP-B]
MRLLSLLLFLALLPIQASMANAAPAGLYSLKEAPIELDVKNIDVVYELREKNIAGFKDPTPQTILTWWFQDRFKAAGQKGRVKFVVHDIHIKETPHEKPANVFLSPRVTFEATLFVTVSVYKSPTEPTNVFHITARSQSQESESLSLFERQKVWTSLIERAINTFDQELAKRQVFHQVTTSS